MMNKTLQSKTSKHFNATYLGLVLMLVPVIISFTLSYIDKEGFWLWEKEIKRTPLHPSMISSLIACAFYVSLIVRYDFFKKDTLIESLTSIAQSFLNIWTLSALLSIAFNEKKPLTTAILICAVAFSWIGMRSIAGYSWITFIVLAAIEIAAKNAKMGMSGAFFIISFTISLLLQIGNLTQIQNFFSEFRGTAQQARSAINKDTTAAIENFNEITSTAIGLATQRPISKPLPPKR